MSIKKIPSFVFWFVTLLVSSGVMAQNTIPTPVTISPQGNPLPPVIYQQDFTLNTLTNGTVKSVFPSCAGGNFYVAFQLYYDLGNYNTEQNWTGSVNITFLDNSVPLWSKQLDVRTSDQTFITSVFHDVLIPCSSPTGYQVRIDTKTLTGTVPEPNVHFRILPHQNVDGTFVPSSAMTINVTNASNVSQVTWTPPATGGTLYYDLEWVFVATHESSTLTTAAQAFAFKEPARINTAILNFSHQTYYPTGKIWYRVRAVGYNPLYPEHRIPGNWTYSADAGISIVNHTPAINWQQQTFFAEGGKNKKIISYYDGSLRKRQDVTNLSTEGTSLVAESAYDFEGRPAISILAVPTDASLIFKPGLNSFQTLDGVVATKTSALKKKFHYDNKTLTNSIMATTSGASKYYSGFNNSTSIHKDFIPDAEGYVYSQTEYTDDGTGRVSRQSGVGKQFKTDGGNITRSFYGSANSTEIVRLFGSNVGNVSHYKKNIVIDPNGQSSVAYMDQEQRVIATALAGTPPANVSALDSYMAIAGNPPITVNLLPNNKIANGTSTVAQRFIKSDGAASVYTFVYDFSAIGSNVPDVGCTTCTYDLRITLMDPDGLPVNLSTFAGNQSTDGYSYEKNDISAADCVNPISPVTVTLTPTLTKPGDYSFVKTLTVNEKSFDEVKTIVSSTTQAQTLITEIQNSYTVDPADCDICTSCDAEDLINEAAAEIPLLDCENILNRIIQQLRDASPDPTVDPTPAQISAHADYCNYTLCVKNRSRDEFGIQAARVPTWTAATTKGYQSLIDYDPFFNNLPGYDQNLSGFNYKTSMQYKLNNVNLGAGIPVGTIGNVTDPNNTAYYVDDNGNFNVNGRHILYNDLMKRRDNSTITMAEYLAELDKQHWSLYRSIYDEALRKTKLEIAEYANCPAAKAVLDIVGGFPTTLDGMNSITQITIGPDVVQVSPSVSDIELGSSILSFENQCGITISAADRVTITGYLQTYFNARPKNLLRIIISSEVDTDPNLVAIRNILNTYGCALSAIAMNDIAQCAPGSGAFMQSFSTMGVQSKSQQTTASDPTAKVSGGDDDRRKFMEKHSARLKEKIDSLIEIEKGKIRKKDGDMTSKNQTQFSTLLVDPPPSQQEYDALWAFYNSTNGNSWFDRTGWSTAAPGTPVSVKGWYGVTVGSDGHVRELNFYSNNNLNGPLPAQLQNLNYLYQVMILQNGITGTIPPELFNCPLVTVYLQQTLLTGSIPTQVSNSAATLRSFTLADNNNMAVTLPTQLGSLTNLWWLSVARCHTTGTIPASFSSMTSLKGLTLQESYLDAEVNLTGTIPTLSPSTLEQLVITGQDFQGAFPASLLSSTYTALTTVFLMNNKFSGSLPTTWSSLPSLTGLSIDGNNFSGTIPIGLKDLPNLGTLSFGYNAFTSIPSDFGASGFPKLVGLFINNNSLNCQLPSTIGNVTTLTQLSLSWNQLYGTIPTSFGNLVNLTTFSVGNNKLTGSIPQELAALSDPNLFFDIQSNQFAGKIPSAFNTMQWNFHANRNNKFTFSDLLELIQNNPRPMYYSPQDLVDAEKTNSTLVGGSFTLVATVDRSTTPASEFQWFKYENGVSTALNTKSTSGHTFTVSNVQAGNTTQYYYQITNSAAPSLTLTSRMQTITTVGGPVCADFDQTNPTLIAWSVSPQMWTDAVQECLTRAAQENAVLIDMATNILIEELVTEYYLNANTSCMANATEGLRYTYTPAEYHYTLYYYDQSGGLVQTVPPKGVLPLTQSQVDQVLSGSTLYPSHQLTSRYQYNSIAQIISQTTPDAGTSQFWYNKKGQLRLSQNAQQSIDQKFSYTRYDEQTRVVEVGEIYAVSDVNILLPNIENLSFPESASYTLKDVTNTFYDFKYSPIQASFPQDNLRSRVSYIEVREKDATDILATYYTYDIHGNVRSLLQQIPAMGNKRTDYIYDLVSGNVNYVIYQYGQPDQFMHKYSYDADNRIKEVYTSVDGWLWDRDAQYKYYLHGPLARTVLGDQTGVQGLDYYYTLQGWMKGVNMPFTDDLTNDGYSTSTTAPRVGRDVFSYTLGYYQNDYKPGNAARIIADNRDQLWARHNTVMGNTGYFNGNIAWMITDLKKVGQSKGSRVKGMQAMLYKYDQLHRIVQSRSLTAYTAGSGFATRNGSVAAAYDEDFSYDANGNLMTLQRKNDLASLTDNFTYSYIPGTNKLTDVGNITADITYTGLISPPTQLYRNITINGTANVANGNSVVLKATNSITWNVQSSENFDLNDNANLEVVVLGGENGVFRYDAIGNLIADDDQGVVIEWTPYGKVRKVTKRDGTSISFRYNGSGERIEKKLLNPDNTGTITRYLRDASGNVMATYSTTITAGAEGTTTLAEQPIYGSSRLGMYRGGRVAGIQKLGTKNFELSNHLGNVLSVITDNIRIQADSAWTTVVNATDYQAFGSEMPNRNFTSTAYRYGFNGKERDGNGEFGDTAYDYGFRIYNPRIARFLSVDPLTKSYPELTPYQFASNTPIQAIDLDGLEAVNLSNGQIDPTLSGKNLQTVQTDRNNSPWQDMSKFRVSNDLHIAANLRGNSITPQRMPDASGDEVSYDYYSTIIEKLPDNMNMEQVFEHIRKKFSQFKVGATDTERIGPSRPSEQDLWESDHPLTSVMRFVVNPNFPWPAHWVREGLAVIASDYTISEKSRSWVFSTVYSDQNGDMAHPLAGHRQFGMIANDNGTYTFFTRGIDTPWGFWDNVGSDAIFAGAHQLWSNVINNVTNYVNKNGGKATTEPNYVSFRKEKE